MSLVTMDDEGSDSDIQASGSATNVAMVSIGVTISDKFGSLRLANL